MPQYTAVIPVAGTLRRIWFDAESVDEAREIATRCNAGLDGEAKRPDAELPVAFDEKKARELLGGISRGTLYNWVAAGRIERVWGTRRMLITRKSIEKAISS
ncbi:MAG: helix-turn-helix domain-containing protein [Ilumatobacteraceae bacterium]